MSEKQVFKTTWGGRPLQIEVGQLAKQANGAVLVRYGDTDFLHFLRRKQLAPDRTGYKLSRMFHGRHGRHARQLKQLPGLGGVPHASSQLSLFHAGHKPSGHLPGLC